MQLSEECAPLMTPPYHPELLPIEELWRDVKQYVASRKYAGTRTMKELRQHVLEGFREYGTKVRSQNKIDRAIAQEVRYREEGVYSKVIDLAEYEDDDTDVEADDLVVKGDDEVDVWQEDDNDDYLD